MGRWALLIVVAILALVRCQPSESKPVGQGTDADSANSLHGQGDSLVWVERDSVIRGIDGDTVELEYLGTVRLIGIDTPESVDPRRPVQLFGREAAAYTAEALVGRRVRIEYEFPKRDRFGRALVYLFVGSEMFNAKIIEDGYAFAYVKYPFKYMDRFVALQQEAREQGRGLWAQDDVALPGYMAYNETVQDSNTIEVNKGTLDVRAGENASLGVKTEPRTACRIRVLYASGPSDSPALTDIVSDSLGAAEWAWEVGTRTTPGVWPIHVSCGSSALKVDTLVVRHSN